jgi:mannose-6-phosphate isomerase-like protein (cupin superfamily)
MSDISKINQETNEDNKSHRPWGWYINICGDDNSGTKVKKIHVNSNKRLSLQSHACRHEHWVIIKGNPCVQVGNIFYVLKKNDYIYIPINEKHRIENNTDEDVEFIETQIGSYLGEDDIIRYEDDFGRA